jgi:hypothetical protein
LKCELGSLPFRIDMDPHKILQLLVGDDLAARSECASVVAASVAFEARNDGVSVGDKATANAMIMVLIAHACAATQHLLRESRLDCLLVTEATELVATLTGNAESDALSWLIALAALRMSARDQPGDSRLAMLKSDHFNALLVDGLGRALHARRAKTTGAVHEVGSRVSHN